MKRDESGGRTLSLGMEEFDHSGCGTLEDAARGDIPPQFATVLVGRVSGDTPAVWLLTNDPAPFATSTGAAGDRLDRRRHAKRSGR